MRTIAIIAALIFIFCSPGLAADNASQDKAGGAKKESGKVSKNSGQKGKEEPVLLKKAGEVGQELNKAGKAIGDATLEGGEKAGRAINKTGKSAGNWFSDASRKTGDTLNNWGRSIRKFFKGDSADK